jgi:hypothetical protein
VRVVLAVERVISIGDKRDGRVRMFVGNGLDSGTGLIAKANPSRRPKAVGDGRIQRLLKRIAQIICSTQHVSTLRTQRPRPEGCSEHLTQTSRDVRGTQPSATGLPSASQFAATFLLAWTRGGSPGIFGVPAPSRPCSPAITACGKTVTN